MLFLEWKGGPPGETGSGGRNGAGRGDGAPSYK